MTDQPSSSSPERGGDEDAVVAAAAPASPAAGLRSSGTMKKRGSVRESMSELLRKARGSFVRSEGTRGADVNQLRGASGADFEGPARIHRGVEGGFCGGGGAGWWTCCGSGNSNPWVDRYLVIKGPFCFVFVQEDAPAPQYAIQLAGMVADQPQQQHSSTAAHVVAHHPKDSWIVLLRAGAVGDVQYEVSFSGGESLAQQFATVVQQQAAIAATEETRKRLGHGHLIQKRESVRFAETVAARKEKEQPEKPISRQEILANATNNMDGMVVGGTQPPL
ncbi:hypothetical protein ACA910_005592 [Epithemia clementina (nom. ined.)]